MLFRSLVERRVAKVWIGMLDPDQRIQGDGIMALRDAGIDVQLFTPAAMKELEEINRDFMRDRRGDARLPDDIEPAPSATTTNATPKGSTDDGG